MRNHNLNDTNGTPEKRSGRPMTLLLVTAAVSFALGMTIGRNTAPVTQMVKVKVPVNQAGQDKLTFYKTLPSGETPALGSGINRPAQVPATATANNFPPVSPPTTNVAATATSVPPPPAAPASASGYKPQSESGSWIVQAAAYTKEEDAQALSKKLHGKGYKTYVESAAVKGKTWYRVNVGPYADVASAEQTAARLGSQNQLNAMVRRH